MSSPTSFTPSLSYFSRLTECPVWQAAFSPWPAQPERLHPHLCAAQVPASPPARLRPGCTPAQREGEGAAPSSPLRRSLFLQAPRTRALCLELIEVSRFQAGMSRECRLLNPLGRASRECPCGSSAHAGSPPARLQGPRAAAPATALPSRPLRLPLPGKSRLTCYVELQQRQPDRQQQRAQRQHLLALSIAVATNCPFPGSPSFTKDLTGRRGR